MRITCYLLTATLMLLGGCRSDSPNDTTSLTLKPGPAIQVLPTDIPTTTLTPTPHTLTLIPTATRRAPRQPTKTPTAVATSPLATPLPTLSLVDMLSQAVVVTATNVVSVTSITGIETNTETNTEVNTAVTPHPEPPIAEQPSLGPQPSQVGAHLTAATLTELQPDGITRTVHIPILMYHYVSTPPTDADIYRRDLSVSPELFAAQLDRLQAEGYATISLYDLTAHLQQGTPLPTQPVLLTFDDGYRDNYENAYPLLHQRRMNATFFIVIDFINRERPEYLSWDMVREMYSGGMSIEVHGVDHTTLRNRNRADLEFQALRSYETIQDRIGVRPRFLSYPAGEYDAATIEIFRSASYWAAVTTIQGTTQHSEQLFELHRIRIRGTTTPDDLVRLLQLDW